MNLVGVMMKLLLPFLWILVSLQSSFAFADIKNLSGLDKDKNGIRDDVDENIAKQNYSAEQLQAVRQTCRSLQLAVTLDSEDRDRAKNISILVNKAIACLFTRFKSSPDPAVVVTQYEKLTANTQSRRDSYKKYNRALDGTVTSTPNDPCENPD